MSKVDRVLSQLVLALFGVAMALLAMEELCEWLAMERLSKGARSLEGKPLVALFERQPVLPDRIVFDSLRPDSIVFSYDEWRWWRKRYPAMEVISTRGSVVGVRETTGRTGGLNALD